MPNKLVESGVSVILEVDSYLLLGHEEKTGEGWVSRSWEDRLQEANLVDQFCQAASVTRLVHLAEYLSDDCKEQVKEHDYIEDNAGEEEKPLGVIVMLSLRRVEAAHCH